MVKNDTEGLRQTRRSLMCQEFTEWEHVVVVASQDDPCLSLAKSFGLPRTNVEVQAGKGIYDAMNQGLQKSKAKYVLFLNAGDELFAEDSLARVCKELGSGEPEWAVFGGHVRWKGTAVPIAPSPKARSREIGLGKAGFMHPSIYYRRDFIAKLGGYDTGFEIAGDLELNLRAVALRAPKIVNVPTSIFYLGGVSSSRVFTSIFEARAARKKSMPRYPFWAVENHMQVALQLIRASVKKLVNHLFH